MNFTIFTSRAVYSCNQGYMISPAGAATERFCRIDGTWGGEEPTCQCEYCTHIHTNGLNRTNAYIKIIVKCSNYLRFLYNYSD